MGFASFKKPQPAVEEDDKVNVLFNPRKSRKIMKCICCLDYFQGSKLVQKLNVAYICFVYLLQVVVILQGLLHGYLATRVAEKVEAIHYTLVIVIISGYITNELLNYKEITEAWEVLSYAFANMSGEEQTLEVHRDNARTVNNMNKMFSCMMGGACASYLCFTPIREALFSQPDSPRSLPIPMYTPFDATQNPGYVLSVLWEGVTLFYLAGVATSIHQSYISYMGALRAELKLLNASVLRTEERAVKLSGKEPDYEDPDFLAAIIVCLKDDIAHHQLLLKYYKLMKSYLGFILLMYIVVASIILAAAGYLLTRPDSPMEETIKFIAIVGSELIFIFQLCWYGDKVSEESGQLFHNLFGGPWYKCGKEMRNSLNIMLIGTLKPIQLKTNVFNITASLETYNSVVNTSFQYFNLLRNIQTI
nr:olfactory receptor 66 [Tropidothorax elegans]QQP19787.1 olfactory receptor 92 [Tropidothorax elegans]